MRELSIEDRLAICRECPIFSPQKGGRCNSNLWLNPDNDDVSTHAKVGYVRGCNCVCSIKARNRNNHCVAGKW